LELERERERDRTELARTRDASADAAEVCVSVKRGLGYLQKRPISSEKRPTIVLA